MWSSVPAIAQISPELLNYFKEDIGLSQDQIANVQQGRAVTKVLKSRTPDEIFIFGAIYIAAAPERYIQFATDVARLKRLPEYLALGRFSNPPQLADVDGFSFDRDEVSELKNCRPGHCEIQIPAEAIEDFHRSIDWTASDTEQQINQLIHQRVIERLRVYQREGNKALGVYQDKEHPTDVAGQFEHILSYHRALPRYLPDFHRYLLAYPDARPATAQDLFYWAKVKFGLKPTLRLIHVVVLRGQTLGEPACAIAEKQLYSSHYFETALDISVCIPEANASGQPGFYLIKAMGSEQAGLTGIKGSIVRKVAVGRTASALEKSLVAIKTSLETNTP